MFEMVGFCRVDVKPFGPLQAYVDPAINGAVKERVVPTQGVVLFTVTAEEIIGKAFTVTPIDELALATEEHPVVVFVITNE